MGHEMIIGYSFWGFLGSGVTDTPDGGRSHRRPLLDGLRERGHEVVLLQADRDRREAGDDLGERYRYDAGLPEIDVLMAEWRWPIPGRNTTPCGSPGHTCDLHRQDELIRHYTLRRRTPTILWDKDRRLPPDDAVRRDPVVTVCEAALDPSPGAERLLFPVADAWLDAAEAGRLATSFRPLTLAYAGNQYDRDRAFDEFFAPAAKHYPHAVGGKWTDTARWPHVCFLGRIPFPDVDDLYRRSLATVLLLPDRYAAVGQMTQRIFEAVLAGCLPLTPTAIRHAHRFTPRRLHVEHATDVISRLAWLRGISGTDEHAELLADCLGHLELFRLSAQLDVLEDLLCRAPHTVPGARREVVR
ncbi:glycosyltransferase family protein [Allostreptomyces psammosilenae]|uniref:Spore protein YkvP/CgeB glycosyl transferase-like domain-containing protein n=1 Tax=Allostreptomyces psammosilenae TaxID=1892865 RepID=A0A852ZV98_9ACTN|nr:hypothetical protein [Allostreptomyces psammosilenae]NYI05547.1 hypothetical protein [Allostreptomyces psammosilenae]